MPPYAPVTGPAGWVVGGAFEMVVTGAPAAGGCAGNCSGVYVVTGFSPKHEPHLSQHAIPLPLPRSNDAIMIRLAHMSIPP